MRHALTLLFVGICLMLPSCAAPHPCYRTSVGTGPDEIPLVVVGGTPYDMGYAVGRLMKDEVAACTSAWLAGARAEMPERCTDEQLDAAWKSVAPHTDKRFQQELRGLADGSGVPYERLLRMHMIPVVSDFACSGVIVWGEATKTGHLLQLRNLDFTVNAHLQEYPLIVIYVPDRGIPHASVTVAGMIGANTGMNARGVVMGEKGESPKKDHPFDLNGTHFLTLFRDVLWEARSLDEAVGMIRSAKLIKRYYFYVGGRKGDGWGGAKVKVTTPDSPPLHVWRDNDKDDELSPEVLPGAVYNTMNNELAWKRLKADSGSYDPDKMIALSRDLASRNGNLLDAVYDAEALEMWVAFAEGSQHAFERPYVHVKMTDYLDPTYVPEGATLLPAKK
ncbi:MAG: hypothetical protein JXQ73_21860 [Phycisphaerae bacterium]|nr:hypothetical protein [Phycisphaerae bacterium]